MYGLKFRINPLKKIYLIGISVMPPFVKPFLYRLADFKIGKNTSIGWFSLIISNEFEIGNNSEISPLNMMICNKVKIGDYAIVSMFNWIYGRASFRIGNHSFIGARSMINCYEDVIIGNFTGIGAESALYTHGVWLPYAEGYPRRFKPIIIGNNVWIPVRVIILPITIGDNVTVGTGSTLYKDIPSDSFVTTTPMEIRENKLKQELNRETKYHRILEMADEFRLQTNSAVVVHDLKVYVGNSEFNFKTRKCIIKDKIAKEFREYMLTYWGEWFDN